MTTDLKIAIASDHAGFTLKEELRELAAHQGIHLEDLGAYSDESVDYPDFGAAVARAVAQGRFDRGVAICGTGIGICMAANKIPGTRAAVCWDVSSARLTREHNDSNVLCLSGRLLGVHLALDILLEWIYTPFSQGERHKRRIKKLADLDRSLEESSR